MQSRIRWGGLRSKIIACSFVPTAIILLTVAGVTFIAYQQVTETLVIERDREVTELSAAQLSAGLAEYTNLLREYTGLLADPTRTTYIDEIDENDLDALRRTLMEARSRFEDFDGGVLVINSRGTVVAAEPERPEILGQNWSGRTYFRRMLRSPETVFSDVVADGLGGVEVIVVAVPITGGQGQFLGIIAGLFRLGTTAISPFYSDIIKPHIGESGSAYLVDGTGRVIYHSDASHIGDDFSAQAVVQQALSGQVDAIRTRAFDGREIVASFAPVPGTGWGLVTEEDWAALISANQGYGPFLLLLLALGVVVPTLIVAVGVRQITKPITELIEATQQVAGGNFGQTISVHTGDEIEDLAEQFNLMSAQLQESYAHLEQRVAERTAELRATSEEVQQRADELAALYETGRDLAATLDLEVLLPAIAQRVTDILGADRCAVFLFDERAGVLRARAAHGYMAERLADFGYRPGEEVVGQAYVMGETQYVPDLDQVPDLPRRDATRAVLAVPLVSPTAGTLGVLSVTSLRPDAFTSDQQRLLETMAGRTAGAIENARLYRVAEESARRALGLYQIGAAVSSTLDLDAILQIVVERSRELLNGDFGEMHLLDAPGGGERRVLFSGLPRGRCPVRAKPTLRGLNGQVLRTGRPVRFADRRDFPGTVPLPAGHLPIGPFLGAPIMGNGGPIADILLARRPGREPFTAQDEETLVTVANQAAMAIENARLYQAAQEADRLKSAFLAAMSHELRTPLNSIIGFTGIILQGLAGPLNDEQTKQMGMVQGSARHLLNLINDVLDISKIEAGQLEVACEPFDMREAIEKAVQTVTPLAEKKGLALVTQVSPEVGQIVSDRRRVEQILINLVNNSIKFTEEGQVTIRADLIPALSIRNLQSAIRIQVVDTGIGIKPEDMGKLFVPFRQVETGLARRHEGTGLGLSICKRLVEMLGGEIWAESKWGVGSTFTFTLPVR